MGLPARSLPCPLGHLGQFLLRSIRFVAERLAPITQSIRVAWKIQPVVNTDEAGMCVMRHRYGFRTVSAPWLICCLPSQAGPDTAGAMDYFPHGTGTTVHHGLPPYDAYLGTQTRRNAHHGPGTVREATGTAPARAQFK